MVDHRLLLIAAAALVAGAAACAPMSTAAPTGPTKAADFEAAISRLQEDDPQSPETLDARLGYADYLSEPAGTGCQQQLAAAQSQLDIVAARPAMDVLLPLGPARIAGDEYKIHLARATCGGGQTPPKPPLKSELQQALEAAQRAVALYRDALDYQSAAIMQFNVAATYQQLQDVNGALAALEAAIAMDREYGFRKDAEDNSKLLLQWKAQKADDGDVAALMKDFPARTANFNFNWPKSDADVTVNVDDTSVIHGEVVRSKAAMGLKRHIGVHSNTTLTATPGPGSGETANVAGNAGWTVSNDPGSSSYDLGYWPVSDRALEWPMLYFLVTSLLQTPGIEIDHNGDFNSVVLPEAVATSLTDGVSAQISARGLWENVSVDDLRSTFSPDFIEAKAAQDYGLETATWIGAKLEQGVWYQMSAPLFLPGLALGHYLVQHDISFAFTRRLPCMTGSSDHLCVEIVVHAIPDADDLKRALQDADPQLRLSGRQSLHVWSRTDLRLVVDPDTLLPYTRDTRQTWYDGLGKSDPMIESVRTVSTSVYQ